MNILRHRISYYLLLRWLCVLVCFVPFQLTISFVSIAEEADLWKNNLSQSQILLADECRKHVNKNMTVYMNMSAKIKKTLYSRSVSDDGVFLAPSDYELVKSEVTDVNFYVNNGKYFRADAISYKNPDFLEIRRETTFLINPEQSYMFIKGKNGYVLMANKMSSSLDIHNLALQLPFNAAFAEAPFGPPLAYNAEFPFFHPLSNCEEISISESFDGDDQIVTIVAHRKFSGGYRGTYTYNFYRNKSWALRDYCEEMPSSDPNRMGVIFQKCVYEGTNNDVPLLKECVIERFSQFDDNKPGPVLHREVYQFSNIKVGPPPLELFDHELLIGKIGIPSAYPFTYFRLIAISLGLLLFLLGIYLKVKSIKNTN